MFGGFFHLWCFAFEGWKMMFKRNQLGNRGRSSSHLSCPEQTAAAVGGSGPTPTPLGARGPSVWQKSRSESWQEHPGGRQLREITPRWLASPKIGICRPCFPMLSWHSSSLEVVISKSFGFYSAFLFSSYCAVSHFSVSLRLRCFTFWMRRIQARCFEWFPWPRNAAYQHRYISLGLLLSMLILLPPRICK